MGSPPQPPTPPSFSLVLFVKLLAAAPPGRDGSTADSFPFDDNRDEKQKEGILEIIKSSDSGSEKAARHDETCLAQVADEEEGSEHNLRTLARSVLDFLSVLKGLAQHNLQYRILDFLSVLKGLAQHNLQYRILDSGASMHATGILRLLSEFTRAPGGSSAAVYHTRDGKDLRIAGAGSFSPIDADAIPFFLPVISCGSPGPQKLDVQLERVIAAFDNRKLIPKHIKANLAAAFTERVEICPTRWLASFASSRTLLLNMLQSEYVAESETSLLLDSGASIHAVGEARLLTGIELFSIDKWAVLPDGTRMRIVGTGTMHTDRFTIPEVHLVDGLKKNLISVSQLDKDHGLCCCFHSKICEVILADGTVVGGAILLDGGIDKWAVLPDDTRLRIVGTGTMQMDGFSIPKVHLVDGLKKNLISVSQLDKDHGLCCCFHSKKCELILADGTVVGGAILQDDYFLEVPAEPEEVQCEVQAHGGRVVGGVLLQDDGMYKDEKQKEGILEIIKINDVVSEKAAPLIVFEDTARIITRQILNFLSVSKGRAQEGRSEHNHLDIILDSGASMHATGNLRLLSEFTRAPGSSSAAVYHTRDGKDLRIAGVGMIACDKFHLPRVHYVPELGSRFTLASVQLLAGCDYLVMFCGGWCYVKNGNNGSLVGRGRMHDEDGLYHLEYLRIPLVVVDGAN